MTNNTDDRLSFKKNDIVKLNRTTYDGLFRVESPLNIMFPEDGDEAVLVVIIEPVDNEKFAEWALNEHGMKQGFSGFSITVSKNDIEMASVEECVKELQ